MKIGLKTRFAHKIKIRRLVKWTIASRNEENSLGTTDTYSDQLSRFQTFTGVIDWIFLERH